MDLSKILTKPGISFSELKASSRRFVASNVFDYAGTAFLGIAIMFALSLPTLGASWILLSGAFSLVMCTFALQVYRKGSSDFNIVLSNYKNFGNAFITAVSIGMRIFLWALVISIPFVIINFLIGLIPVSRYVYDSYWGYSHKQPIMFLVVIMTIIKILVSLTNSIIIAVFTKRYALTFFILSDNPEMGASKAVQESIKLMEGHEFELFLLNLSFILWYLLVIVTFGLANIYVAPYVAITHAAYYEKLKALKTPKTAPAAPEAPQPAAEPPAEN